jgi:dUTP pyrophosphatase
MNLQELMKKLQDGLSVTDNDQLNDALRDSGIDLELLENDMKNYSPTLKLRYTLLHEEAKAPSYNYETDSGFDLYATEPIVLRSFERALVPTGISFDIPSGHEIQVRSKSGLAINQGLFVLNSPGTVDAGYTGEVKVIVLNTSKDTITITKGMKVAQAVLCPVVAGKWVELDRMTERANKDRNENGFGSTGLK